MFLAQSVSRYSISYDTKINKNLDIYKIPALASESEPSSTQNDGRDESDDQVKASFWEQIKFTMLYVNGSNHLNDEERETLNAISAQLAK